MASVTISAGAKEGAYGGEDGTFVAILTKFGDLVSTDNEGNALISDYTGQPYSYREWEWAIEDAPQDACMVWARTSGFAGPKSTTYAWLTGLFGGKEPPAGTTIDSKDLEGRAAMITVRRDQKSGFYKVDAVVPLPRSMQRPVAKQDDTPAPDRDGDRKLPF